MKTVVGKFKFEVPTAEENPHPDAGKKIEKPFEYQECETDAEAEKVLKDKKLSIRDMVNDKLKTNARSSAYQAALLPYKPSDVPVEDIQERMVRDFIRLGIPEEIARKNVAAMMQMQAAQGQNQETETEEISE